MYLLLYFYLVLCAVSGIRRCFHETISKYYKVKQCYRSTLSVIAWKSVFTTKECVKFAREKRGLAFNYSPAEVQNSTGVFIFQNCQILGCPEVRLNSSSLLPDPSFDYYSAFATENSTCIKSVGLFSIFEEKRNYTDAIIHCQSIGADLADILSETRTNALGFLLKSLSGWYKAAYVGLEDTIHEGIFETPLGNFLECTKFRAWSPGHPRKMRKKDDCVSLDAERVWRAINCKIKLPFICEFFPESPPPNNDTFVYKDCSSIKNTRSKEKCFQEQELFELYNSSSRIDQCALLND